LTIPREGGSKMATDAQDKKQPAPYISWKTFNAFIASIHGKVPAQIDSSILRNMSGTARSQLLSALKFLDLIDTDGTTRDSLKKLAEVYNGEQWKPALVNFLRGAYAKVVGDLNLNTATPAMLRERFRNNGSVDGGTVDLAVRFYLSALKEAGVPFSDHLVVRQRAPKGSGTRKRRDNDPDLLEDDEGPDTFRITWEVLELRGGVSLPKDIELPQWKTISDYVETMLGFRIRARKKV
jgi:hypothetical protein